MQQLLLRTRLLKELQQNGGDNEGAVGRPKRAESLLLRLANSLVCEHLRVCQYSYSLSVFVSESELPAADSKDAVGEFARPDVLRLLRVDPSHDLAETSGHQQQASVLLAAMAALSRAHASAEVAVQADDPNSEREQDSIEWKLRLVEREFTERCALCSRCAGLPALA